ncbi:MAG: hypothetical protein QF898_12895 [SAR202 cluster bacterium]|nr:hypothetical protein [SAR202 cluster bacterium]MDP6514952.1 hypothetical protein [SAR202 cluster bacterium]MDP6714846.1 hypothetical protein [SAR202 cluster bacterium]
MTLMALTVALVVAACGSSSEPAVVKATTPPTSVPVAPVAPAPTSVPSVAVVPTQPPAQDVKIGNSVGDHVPEFEFSLADGTKVTSASLSAQSDPAYLFFFAVW